jgi:hypothetical protein
MKFIFGNLSVTKHIDALSISLEDKVRLEQILYIIGCMLLSGVIIWFIGAFIAFDLFWIDQAIWRACVLLGFVLGLVVGGSEVSTGSTMQTHTLRSKYAKLAIEKERS